MKKIELELAVTFHGFIAICYLSGWPSSPSRLKKYMDRRRGYRRFSLTLHASTMGVKWGQTSRGYEATREAGVRRNKAISGDVMSIRHIIADRFEISSLENDLLGRAGMGDVYRGMDTQTGKTVAVKVLKQQIVATNSNLVARFVREGEALRQLSHPNIVKMVDAFEERDEFFLVMEYVAGGSLADVLETQGALPIARGRDRPGGG